VGCSVAPLFDGEESPDRIERESVENTAGGNFGQAVTENNRSALQSKGENVR